MADYSPMMKQYFEVKKEHPNSILFFRLGDFYEMFFNDAKTVSQELDLTLTGRDCGQGERAPMCGIPFHSAEGYITKLLAKGYRVTICDQVEDPKSAKGLVKREIVRVITPGTVLEGSMLDEARNNYICSMYYCPAGVGLCFADVSTGELHAGQMEAGGHDFTRELENRLTRYSPREILINPQFTDLTAVGNFIRERLQSSLECLDEEIFALNPAKAAVERQFNGKPLAELGLEDKPLTIMALGALLDYLSRTQITGLERITEVELETDSAYMALDLSTMRNLELIETMRNKERKGSLLWVLDRTKTAMGKRLIRAWLERPLLSPAKITLRLNAVEELVGDQLLLDELVEQLTGIHDLERIMTRVVYGSANGRELRALCAALQKLPGLKRVLERCQSTLLGDLNFQIDSLEDVAQRIDRAIDENPPFTIREGKLIKKGYSPELDEIRSDMSGGQALIASVEARERERTGIPKLKVGFNKVFGYYIEVTNSYKDQVPQDYIRKQTLTGGERYITPELKELENRVLGAHDRSIELEGKLFEEIRRSVAQELNRIQQSAKAVASLDVLASFAVVSIKNDYSRPVVNVSGKLYLKDGRHPVVEALLHESPFVPNDVDLDMNDTRVAVITGPNMAGKSTYMRQIAIIAIMAQIGCFVPAAVAEIGIVDGIYTRVGASDDLSAGQSTFMIEMSEVAEILRNATSQSLIIFDEIGRGTSTFDGMSIARAVLEYVQDPKLLGAKTLFATHYHELTEMESLLSGVRNFNIAVKKRGDDITFLRRIVRGGADDSFGIEVAKLAGVPDKVIRRAKQVLAELESTGGEEVSRRAAFRLQEEPVQLTIEGTDGEVLQKLRTLDVNALTPIQCMNTLFELCNLLKD
ncbi:DNA mismatch repair protein MutS [Acutalibacter sp. 1XD8-33]|uniref:DNA mismatch repair protein MutS n=1 Tax=Acutalibacter sp. 1XD8-33 TaxID=2320081 RepID=UPI000EA33277|nr:DNA mismatch repair protein MutS [Acutalibacter sp. 1XD8-33]RKJ40397.1 DNA mismatch repair protein MutS [Acutalibacter sp. 1XD8-33]